MGISRLRAKQAATANDNELTALAKGTLRRFVRSLNDAELGAMDIDDGDSNAEIAGYLEPERVARDAAGRGVAGGAAGAGPAEGVTAVAPSPEDYAAGRGTPSQTADFLKRKLRLRSSKQMDTDIAKRVGPINLAAGEADLKFAGNYLALFGYDPALDHLLRSLARMSLDYSRGPSDDFIVSEQLLRAIGAPGLGKSTFIKFSWSMVLPRLEVVQADAARWQTWKALGVESLQERMESWKTSFGPLVYMMDMSKELRRLWPREMKLTPDAQVATRMLWAAAETESGQDGSYASFLANLDCKYPNLLANLTPRIVQYFVHLAAGLPAKNPSLIVFVWDEANAVEGDADNKGTTFFQAQLSSVVSSRVEAHEARAKQAIDVMLVPVVASTRGSALDLVRTASKKAGHVDLRLPLIKSVDDWALMVMDFMRRLPLPQDIIRGWRVSVKRDHPLSAMSQQDRDKLQQSCPAHVRQLLHWVGTNPRLMVAAVSILSRKSEHKPYHISCGQLTWFKEDKLSMDDALRKLYDVMMEQGWKKWFSDSQEVPQARMLLQAAAYGLCNIPVSRWQVLTNDVTLQRLEADGVIELRSADHTTASSTTSSPSSSCGGGGTDPAKPADDDDGMVYVYLPPLLLAAVLQNSVKHPDGKRAQLSFASLLTKLCTTNWRQREFDDVSSLTLRLQLLRQCLEYSVVEACQLFRPLASTSLGDRSVQISSYGFCPSTIPLNISNTDVATLLKHVAWPEQYKAPVAGQPPWAFVFNGHNGPGDSMLVLRLCDSTKQPSADLLVIHLQSKLRAGLEQQSANWRNIEAEASKVKVIDSISSGRRRGRQTAKVHQVFLYVSDEQLPTGRGKRRAESSACITRTPPWRAVQEASPLVVSGPELSKLAQGECVPTKTGLEIVAVFRDSQWDLRGAAQLIKELLDKAASMEDETQRRLSELNLGKKTGKTRKTR